MSKIIIVDDNVRYAAALSRFFEDEGHEVRVCESGAAAAAEARSFPPALLVCDWVLRDGSNGLSVARTTREICPDVAIVFITGLPRGHVEPELAELQGTDVFEKPFDLDALLATSRRLLDGRT